MSLLKKLQEFERSSTPTPNQGDYARKILNSQAIVPAVGLRGLYGTPEEALCTGVLGPPVPSSQPKIEQPITGSLSKKVELAELNRR